MVRHAAEHLHRTSLCPGVCRGHDDGTPFHAGSGREFGSGSVLFFADCAGSCRLASLRCDALDTHLKRVLPSTQSTRTLLVPLNRGIWSLIAGIQGIIEGRRRV